MTKEELVYYAKAFGADLVGVAPMDRFEGAPPHMDPRFIMPDAKSMIVMAFRVMRGSLRGIEEGTFFSNYSAMGYGGLTYTYIPMTVINLCKLLEDDGYESIPLGHQSDWRGMRWNGESWTAMPAILPSGAVSSAPKERGGRISVTGMMSSPRPTVPSTTSRQICTTPGRRYAVPVAAPEPA